jgi:carbonic anhydrase
MALVAGPFVASTPFVASHPNALAIYCSDGRFTEPVEELLRHLGHPRLDVLAVAGGAGLLDPRTAGVADRAALGQACEFLVESHAIRHVVLVAHEGCGYYGRRYGMHAAAEIRARQVEDLRSASRALRDRHHGLEVACYYAHVVGGAVHFDPL